MVVYSRQIILCHYYLDIQRISDSIRCPQSYILYIFLLLPLLELQELKFAFNCLFQDCYFGDSALIYTDEEVEDGKGELSVMKKFDAEAVFNQIDTDNAGRIDINKFKVSILY